MLIPFTSLESTNMVLRRLYFMPISKAVMYLDALPHCEVHDFYYKSFTESQNYYKLPPFYPEIGWSVNKINKLNLLATCLMVEVSCKDYNEETSQDLEYELNSEMFEEKIHRGSAIALVHGFNKPLNLERKEYEGYLIHPDYPLMTDTPCAYGCIKVKRTGYEIYQGVYYTPLEMRYSVQVLEKDVPFNVVFINSDLEALKFRFSSVSPKEGVTLDFQRKPMAPKEV